MQVLKELCIWSEERISNSGAVREERRLPEEEVFVHLKMEDGPIGKEGDRTACKS